MAEPASNPGGWAAALQGAGGDAASQQLQAAGAAPIPGSDQLDASQLNLSAMPNGQTAPLYQTSMGAPLPLQYAPQGTHFDQQQMAAPQFQAMSAPLVLQQQQQALQQQIAALQQHQQQAMGAPPGEHQPQQPSDQELAQQGDGALHANPQQQVDPGTAAEADAYAAQLAAAQATGADHAMALQPPAQAGIEEAAVPDPADYLEPGALEEGRAKPCRLCSRVQMLSNFHVNNSNADKHDTRCKRCCAAYEKEKRAKKQRVHEPTVLEKQCRSCNETKSAADFYRYTYSKDGLYQQCKACHAKAGEERLARLAATEAKTCSKCGQEKPKTEFYASKYLSSGLHSQCKRCVRQGQEKKVRCPPEHAATSKVCRKCRSEKPAADFFLNKLVSDGLSTYCRNCSQASAAAGQAPSEDGTPPPRTGARYNVETPTKTEKHCKKCGETKVADEFYHIKSSSDGLASNCKQCAVKIANATRKHFNPEPTVSHKVCRACQVDKPAEAFYRNRTNADGLFGKCKVCSDAQAEQNRKPRVRHNISEPTVEHKVCTKCDQDKPASEFNRDKTKADGLQFRCKICVHEYMKRRRRTESTRKRDEMEAAQGPQHDLATDNLAVLAQAADPAGGPGSRGAVQGQAAAAAVQDPSAAAAAAQFGLQLPPGVALTPQLLEQIQHQPQLFEQVQQQVTAQQPQPGYQQQLMTAEQAAAASQQQQQHAQQQMAAAAAAAQPDGGAAAAQQQAQQPGNPAFVDDDMDIEVDVEQLRDGVTG